ncbi:DUF2844 domain-containing protein [Paraburkholderia sp. UCT31]|uniref:DUF2844 domain-containing protein n=1 Tax=Paraburkholderia sp. UCT31 TaxID=2615209 RepID=UPI001654DC91|nr:DUF2844 domain-containing protein [Paraburkholderia sp. UCT31]MBC8738516.1 DUF2844 domain-containing protein [Paraburkholderia sp. UCT31]
MKPPAQKKSASAQLVRLSAKRAAVPAIMAACLLAASAANAALGQAPLPATQSTTRATAAVQMSAPRSQVPAAVFTTQTSQLANDVTVTEYVDGSGKVFAVTWRGPVLPNLQTLLGTYFPEYVNAPSSHNGRGFRSADTGDLVVQSSGHMRAFTGAAYLKSLMPAGVSAADLQ